MKKRYRVQFKEFNIYLGAVTYKVLQPTYQFENLYVCHIDNFTHIIFGDEDDLIELSKVIAIQTKNTNYIIHIPSQKKVTDYLKERWGINQSFDLILVSHTLQLKIKDWKTIRSKLKSYDIIHEEVLLDKKLNDSFEQFHYNDNKDILKIYSNYNTLFLVSSELVFYNMIDDCVDVSENGRDLYNRMKGTHDHRHLEYYLNNYDRNYKKHNITIDYYDEELWLT